MSRKRQERINTLREALGTRDVLRLKDAAALLGVSEMTVRRDIAACDGCLTYLGGYIVAPPESAGGMGYILDRERESHSSLKRAACMAAAGLLAEQETIFLDCGTTIPHLAALLPENKGLTVVCYAMNVAEIVCKKPGVRVILLGGLYHPSSASFSSPESLELLKGLGINRAFISAGGIHAARGVSCSNFHEIAIKQTAMTNALSNVLVVDSTKFDVVKPMFFSSLDRFDIVAVDDQVTPESQALIQDAGARLITA
jgi:DeoR family deoxyribose operon repressor